MIASLREAWAFGIVAGGSLWVAVLVSDFRRSRHRATRRHGEGRRYR